jgi:uncharacterized RDD family membrane protein YckC
MECENCGLENLTEARFCADCGTALVPGGKKLSPVEPKAQVKPAIAIEYMGFWLRFVAAIVDALAVSVISYALTFIFGLLPDVYLFLYSYLNSFIVLLLYYWLFTGLKGQTPGKMIVGIKVADMSGNKPGLLRAALREIPGKIISTIAFYIGFLWIAWDKKKQGFHDKLATTYVIKV